MIYFSVFDVQYFFKHYFSYINAEILEYRRIILLLIYILNIGYIYGECSILNYVCWSVSL